MLDEENNRFILNDEIITFGRQETMLLDYLISRKYTRTSMNAISEKLYCISLDESTKNVIVTQISKLNKKLKGIYKIKNKYNVGYKIEYVGNKT